MQQFFAEGYVQATMAIIVTLTWAVLVIWSTVKGTTLNVPEIFIAVTGLVFGYYFRASANVKAIRAKIGGNG